LSAWRGIGPNQGDLFMLLFLVLILFAIWLIEFVVFHVVAGGLIHLLLVVAIIALIVHFSERRAV
jgi:tryptophan-rich sensory protein